MHHHGLLPHGRSNPQQHRYEHVPTQGSAAEDCWGCFGGTAEERYVFVGEGRGHFEESMRGNFHYVGPGGGHFEKQRLAPKRTWQRCISLACVLVAFAAVSATVVWYMFLAPAPLFDCFAGIENAASGWSSMKKEYCCENEGVGCSASGLSPGLAKPPERIPEWLDGWLWDFSLGIKFTVSAFLVLVLGCCCGASAYNTYLVKHASRRRSPTEIELGSELKRLLRRLGARTGELAVSLMWDTADDLDLHLRLPTGEEISAENPQAHGGWLDVDGNNALQLGDTKPVENISWPEYDPHGRDHPPEGEYTVYVKVYSRFQTSRDPNITVSLSVSGEQELFHQKITACCCEVKVCSFVYRAPSADFQKPRR